MFFPHALRSIFSFLPSSYNQRNQWSPAKLWLITIKKGITNSKSIPNRVIFLHTDMQGSCSRSMQQHTILSVASNRSHSNKKDERLNINSLCSQLMFPESAIEITLCTECARSRSWLAQHTECLCIYHFVLLQKINYSIFMNWCPICLDSMRKNAKEILKEMPKARKVRTDETDLSSNKHISFWFLKW